MKRAFTLVELSIVLVILGLLVGGVLSGQSLIRSAEMRNVSAEYSKYQTALYSFRDKYFGLPGDLTNATTIWGSAGGTGLINDPACYNTPAASAPTPTATCNGDGNGYMGASYIDERWRAWQQLGNAGLIEGTYSGARATVSGYPSLNQPGVNDPGSKISPNAYWIAALQNAAATTSNFSQANWNNSLWLSTTTPYLTPSEAWNIDTKLDDGQPGTGKVTSTKGNGTSTFCTSVAGSVTDAGATYRLDITSKDCVLYFPNVI